jgi:hypothetical protein
MSKIKYARFRFADYADCLGNRDLAADIMQDLVRAGLTGAPAVLKINQTAIDEGYKYIAEKKRKVAEWNKRRESRK